MIARAVAVQEAGVLAGLAAVKTRESGRLDEEAWVQAAMEVLVSRGVDEVRIEPLAKQLGVTKGSFYYHFKDRAALLDALLQSWRRRATLGVIEWLERNEAIAMDRLKRLIHLPCSKKTSGASIELAMRLWARADPTAAAVLSEVDALRLSYIASLLRASGVDEETAMTRAALIYAYVQAEASIAPLADKKLAAKCEDMLLEGL